MSDLVEQLAESLTTVSDESFRSEQALPQNLQESYRYFLSVCDGGYTNDCFFHFFGKKGPAAHNLFQWDRADLWKKYYGLDDNSFVFAEDIFGTQFFFDIRGNRRVVKMLIPDARQVTLCANTFEDFVESEVFNSETNVEVRQLAKAFLAQSVQPFRRFHHIACKIPPSLGGSDSDLSNLQLVRGSTNLRILGQIFHQVRLLPPGTQIDDVKIDYEREEIILVPQKGGRFSS